jgi:hypothetical protein
MYQSLSNRNAECCGKHAACANHRQSIPTRGDELRLLTNNASASSEPPADKFDGRVYRLTVVNFPSYLVKANSSYLRSWTYEAYFQAATFSRRSIRAGVA